ncbi:MAG TPA: M20/M25/M40 family metallo-hydrolase [Candidatus Saccharimonadales bacterium]|nr:M20/M25/M40 family metallo-hydrolase [Candidatus Saccharimonadales bacterium]
MITPLELTKQLISLPSYVSDTQDETPVIEFLAGFLATSFPTMTVGKQYLANTKRCNLVLRGKNSPKLFALGHIDTVQPKAGWQTNPLQPLVKAGKLYGLGAADMKGSLAAFLCALLQERRNIKLDDLMLLMYVDEEYDFKGMKRFLSDDTVLAIQPKLTLSLDGELSIASGCRGLIELSLRIKGRSGHAANPDNGINAITQTIAALQTVNMELAACRDNDLGETTTNLAFIQGGVLQTVGNKNVWLREGNVIPDAAELVFEVRPALPALTAELVLRKIKAAAEREGLRLVDSSIRHDIPPWPVDYDRETLAVLKKSYANAGVPFRPSDRRLQGYIDAQMVTEKITAPTVIIGTGGNNKHGADEHVPLKNIEATSRVYAALLREVLA